ncbi:MAG TPA: CPBP family intramembrane glutamic endopeptidase [Nocardioides sp.]|nr:CPBP family intramembrane glutamic endopeptidase [Nocardioides sp.]
MGAGRCVRAGGGPVRRRRLRRHLLGAALAIVAAGVLVGFAEEMVFRGIFLRAMRAGARPEGQAALWTAVAFGLFHLPNVFLGTGLLGLVWSGSSSPPATATSSTSSAARAG